MQKSYDSIVGDQCRNVISHMRKWDGRVREGTTNTLGDRTQYDVMVQLNWYPSEADSGTVVEIGVEFGEEGVHYFKFACTFTPLLRRFYISG